MHKKFLITGGAGFVGTNLSERLCAEGASVIVVDNLSGGKRERLPEAVTFYDSDIRDTETLTKYMKDVDAVFHLAALPRVQFSIKHPKETHDVNVTGTLSVLEAARAAGVKRVVYAASSSAYGDQDVLPLHEGLPPQPKSPYALQKYIGEMYLRLWNEIYGIETVSLRFFNVYGQHMDPDGAYALVVGKFLKMWKEGKPLTITGSGEQSRDFTHVSDIVDALVRASERDTVGNGEVLNIGAGHNVSINELAALIGGEIEYVPERLEPMHTCADNTKARTLLGWEPQVSIEEGIKNLKETF